MSLIDLLQWWNLVFELPFIAALIPLLLQAIGAAHLGHGGHDVHLGHGLAHGGFHHHDLPHLPQHHVEAASHGPAGHDMHTAVAHHGHAQTEHHAESPGLLSRALGLLGIGKVPFMTVFSSFCFVWGFTGIMSNQLIGRLIPVPAVFIWPSVGVALVSSLVLTSGLSNVFYRLMPSVESYGTPLEELTGRTGHALYEINSQAGAAVVLDDKNNRLQVKCSTENAQVIPRGAKITLMRYDEETQTFFVCAAAHSQARAGMPGGRGNLFDEIYNAALKQEPAQRAEFLRQACAGDEPLRAEIESRLAHEEPLGSFLQKPAVGNASVTASAELLTGQMLGPYRVEALLGAGGMGTVYRARDTRLGRAVAVKQATKEFSGRFLAEARAVAALNHPHVCTLYDIGPNYLVMELVEGESLASRLRNGPLPLDEILRLGIQIADALAAAHARGIIHRDLKPGNIMVTETGIKVLDFGLAKLVPAAGGEDATLSLELALRTKPGAVVGTVSYMSPEQARGEESDARTDLFSLGVVLHEMATGKRPFDGNTNAIIFDAVLNRPAPSARQLNSKVPEALDEIIRKATEKDRERRYQHATDLGADLKRLQRSSQSPPQTAAVDSSSAPKTD
jgi:hypothetical protein